MRVARTTIGSAPRTTLIWVRVRELGFKRMCVALSSSKINGKVPPLHALRVVGSMVVNNLDPRFWPSHSAHTFLIHISSDPQLTMRYLHQQNTFYPSFWRVLPRDALSGLRRTWAEQKVGESRKYFFCFWRNSIQISEFYMRRYMNYWDLLWICYFCPRSNFTALQRSVVVCYLLVILHYVL